MGSKGYQLPLIPEGERDTIYSFENESTDSFGTAAHSHRQDSYAAGLSDSDINGGEKLVVAAATAAAAAAGSENANRQRRKQRRRRAFIYMFCNTWTLVILMVVLMILLLAFLLAPRQIEIRTKRDADAENHDFSIRADVDNGYLDLNVTMSIFIQNNLPISYSGLTLHSSIFYPGISPMAELAVLKPQKISTIDSQKASSVFIATNSSLSVAAVQEEDFLMKTVRRIHQECAASKSIKLLLKLLVCPSIMGARCSFFPVTNVDIRLNCVHDPRPRAPRPLRIGKYDPQEYPGLRLIPPSEDSDDESL